MKASEWKIGNWWTNGENNYVMDISTMQDMIIALEDGFTDLYQPIPLTPEWLDRFGFNEITSPSHYARRFRKNRVDIYWMPNGSFFFRYNQKEIKIEYVHQLQNLYFALTGEELEIND